VFIQGADGKPQAVQVMLGITDGQSTEVVRGELKEGQDVLTGVIGAPSSSAPRPGTGGGPRLRL
jgi:HlyD family secretion protein